MNDCLAGKGGVSVMTVEERAVNEYHTQGENIPDFYYLSNKWLFDILWCYYIWLDITIHTV